VPLSGFGTRPAFAQGFGALAVLRRGENSGFVFRMTSWQLSVALARWKHRIQYIAKAPLVYRNWWSMLLPKLGIDTVLHLRSGARYYIRARTLDLSIVNENAFLDPYLGSGFVSIGTDAIVVDVGANIGDFTVQAARRCPKGRVIAIEPVKDAGEMIEMQARLNGLDNVTWICAALSGTDGMSAPKRSNSIYATASASAGPVHTATLSRLVADLALDRIDLLKLDCEGDEWDILPASDAVLPIVRQLCMEFHCERGWTPQKLAEWLQNRGFEVTHTGDTGREGEARQSWNGLLWARRRAM
jgi:FkbM family methyltransferase